MRASVRVEGVREAQAAFRRMPKVAKRELADRTKHLAEVLAASAQIAGIRSSAQSALVAPLVRARKGATPYIAGGGSRLVGRNRVPAHKVLFGAEFGANHLKQFRPHTGRVGYWLFPTVEREKAKITAAWLDVAQAVQRDFTKGGP
jgi:hypothetical protein